MVRQTISVTIPPDVLVLFKYKTRNISATLTELMRQYNNTSHEIEVSNMEEKKKEIYKLQAELAIMQERHEKELKELEEKSKEVEYKQRPETMTGYARMEDAGNRLRAVNWDYSKLKENGGNV